MNPVNILRYAKSIVAGVAAVLIVASSVVDGGAIDTSAIIAVLAALGVYAVPNKEITK